ncbi:MAG: tetratricopeptide repeat protein, partial [Actinomycetota bacterium]
EARLHFKLAVDARNAGDEEAANRHFDRAIELAPYDFTISRAAMPLRGEDPFGEKFLNMMQEWIDLGAPYHGISRRSS